MGRDTIGSRKFFSSVDPTVVITRLGSYGALRGAPWWLTMKSGDKGNKDNELNYKRPLGSNV